MKYRFLGLIIIVLIFTVGFIQYRIINIDKNNTFYYSDGEVKSVSVDLRDTDFNKLTLDKLSKPPQKKENYLDPNILARSYILMDPKLAYPLLQKDPHKLVSVASTTKIMTAIIVLENYNLDDIITISQNAATQIGSEVQLKIEGKYTVLSLLYALLVQSGNDAAMALAEHMPDGGLDKFIRMMNEKVNYLGLKNTKFKDPAGLNDEGKSTPFDLALMTSYALRNPTFSKIVATSQITISTIDAKFSHELKSSNRLIKGDEPLYYPPALGVKTGFTPEAGHSLVSAAKKGNIQLVAVVLNTYENTVEASAKESRKLLEWGFENFTWN